MSFSYKHYLNHVFMRRPNETRWRTVHRGMRFLIRSSMYTLKRCISSFRGTRIYVVTMYRYGSAENHSYILGTYLLSSVAICHAQREIADRAGKYEAHIQSAELIGNTHDLGNLSEGTLITVWDSLASIGSHCTLTCNETDCSCTIKDMVHNNVGISKIRIL